MVGYTPDVRQPVDILSVFYNLLYLDLTVNAISVVHVYY